MNILQVAPRYPPQSGGVETHVKEISERLVDRGHNVTVLTADAGQEGSQRERRNGVQIRRYRSIAPNNAIHFCPQLSTAVRTTESDIIHAHNYHSFPLVFAALGVDDRRFVVTTHYHGGSASSVRDQLLSMYRPFGRWAVRQADTVIAVSEWEHDQLAADFGVDAKVIPNGLDIERFTAADPEIRDQPYLLTVGRLEKYKGVQHAIQVMSEFPKYELLIAGSGPYQPELAQIAREVGVIDRVTFLGYVAAERLPKLYAGAEVYLTLSEFESYGMTVAEALATGTPCVVATSGALADWTAQRGCLGVDALDTAAISKAIRNAADLEGESTAVSSWETVVEQLLTEYDLLVD